MLTTYYDITNFKSKNATIRMADNLAREVANSFAYPSFSKMMKLKRIPWEKYKKLSAQTNAYRQIIKENIENKYTDFARINTGIETIKNNRMTNCLELSFLAFIFAKCRGIKNCSLKYLFSSDGSLDHIVLYVNSKKPYVIDPWLGFADYVPKAIERYNSEFRKFLGFEQKNYQKDIIFMDEMTVNSKLIEVIYEFRHNDLPKNLLKQLRKHYPEFFTNSESEKQKGILKLFSDIVRRLFRKENS